MRVLTYSDPFNINNNEKIWNIVKRYPHFCASNTLVQGLTYRYGRESFGYINTVDELLKKLYGTWLEDPSIQVTIFLTVSKLIKDIEDLALRGAFEFNKKEVTDAIMFLISLKADSSQFDRDQLNKEQIKVLEMYDYIKTMPLYKKFIALDEVDIVDFEDAVRKTLISNIQDEVNKGYKKEEQIHLKDLKTAYGILGKRIDELYIEIQGIEVDGHEAYAKRERKEKQLSLIKHFKDLLDNEQEDSLHTIVIHGIHRITPMLYFLINQMRKWNIEVVFLVNYCANIPSIYSTWDRVYEWCGLLEGKEAICLEQHNKVGKAIAQLLEGKEVTENLEGMQILKYDNLMTFANEEVSDKFKNAEKKLYKMESQYYAVKGKEINEILKVYFPEHFKEKQFLAYPIGQFILGIYNMWDFDKASVRINDASLMECIVADLYSDILSTVLLDTWYKIKLYFSDIEYIDEYEERLEVLKNNKRYIDLAGDLYWYKRISFFAIAKEDLEAFGGFLNFIKEKSEKLFAGRDPKDEIEYGEHFKELITLIEKPVTYLNKHEKELELINGIKEKFAEYEGSKITGSFQDVQEAIGLYLSSNKDEGDSSNWIVRDFEQVDGGVLLSEVLSEDDDYTDAYHLALVSNKHMTKETTDLLNWPLTVEMFKGYKELESAIPVITKGITERKAFLRYSLFYATFFTRKKIMLSYIGEEDGEEQSAYYVLRALGLKEKEIAASFKRTFKKTIKKSNSEFKREISKNVEDRELFSICPYKYLLARCFQEPIIYSSDYHIKYYISNEISIKLTPYKEANNIEQLLDEAYEQVHKLFPFWNELALADLKRTSKKNLRNAEGDIKEWYKRRKRNFLLASWEIEDRKTKQKIQKMQFNKDDVDKLAKIYMEGESLYPDFKDLPHEKVCEHCSYTEICLRNYCEVRENV